MKVVEVLTEYGTRSLDRTFTYLYDGKKALRERFRVQVSFGPKKVVGFALRVRETGLTKDALEKRDGHILKFLYEEDIIDEEPLLSESLLALAKKVADYYFAPLISVLQAMLPPSLSPRRSSLSAPKIAYEKWVELVDKSEEGLTPKQIELLRLIALRGPILKKEAGSAAVLEKLLEKGKVKILLKERMRFQVPEEERENPHELTFTQQAAYDYLLNSDKSINLLQGVTGSGKTEVYLHLAETYLKEGKNVLFLVPEINLTPALMDYCVRRFGKAIAILHSGLTPAERYDEYRRILRKEARVVVGARSAVFAPLSDLGLIILDEEHVESYKQDNAPFYHAREVAAFRASLEGAKLILGSATPSLETKARAMKGVYGYVEMKVRVNARPLPKTTIVDLREKKNRSPESEKLSRPLLELLREKLEAHEQSLLLINRRGYWTGIECPKCGHLFLCPSCGGSLTYHKEDGMLKCHHCGYADLYPERCPECGNPALRRIGYGTERVVKETQDIFPTARIARLDGDVGRVGAATQKILGDFKNDAYDILVGTQMIAKGHDFPLLTLSAVVLADIGLTLPTYRAAERTFGLIAQACGRSGRSNRPGIALIQTYNPEHYAIVYGASQDYERFFRREMQERKLGAYPPYVYLILLVFSGPNENKVASASLSFKEELSSLGIEDLSLIGPIIPYYAKENGNFRRTLLLKFKKREHLEKALRDLLDRYSSFSGVRLSVNVDPLDY